MSQMYSWLVRANAAGLVRQNRGQEVAESALPAPGAVQLAVRTQGLNEAHRLGSCIKR